MSLLFSVCKIIHIGASLLKYVVELYKLALEPSFTALEASQWLTFQRRFCTFHP